MPRTRTPICAAAAAAAALALAAAGPAFGQAPAPASAPASASAAASASAPVIESTDPAKAAAVQRQAREIQERAKLAPKGSRTVGLARSGPTEPGPAYLSGGITDGDRRTMHAERGAYSLWVATVAKKSGAYLADARLRIVDLKTGHAVVERTMEGPWFMVSLLPGRYEVQATLQPDGADKPQTLGTKVNIAAKGQRQAVLRFDSTAQVAPESAGAFGGNPFGAAASAPR